MENHDAETLHFQRERIKALELELYTLRLSLQNRYQHSAAFHQDYTTLVSCFQFPFHRHHVVAGPFQQVTYLTKKYSDVSFEPVEFVMRKQVQKYFDAMDEKMKGQTL